ncbi:MAG: hypothetical protein ABIG40_03430 [Parcubacteria group bacterium]
MGNIIKFSKLAAIIGVFISALIAISLVLDLISTSETREILTKTLLVIGILTLASIVINFISKTREEK